MKERVKQTRAYTAKRTKPETYAGSKYEKFAVVFNAARFDSHLRIEDIAATMGLRRGEVWDWTAGVYLPTQDQLKTLTEEILTTGFLEVVDAWRSYQEGGPKVVTPTEQPVPQEAYEVGYAGFHCALTEKQMLIIIENNGRVYIRVDHFSNGESRVSVFPNNPVE